jgi:hypothetical protein
MNSEEGQAIRSTLAVAHRLSRDLSQAVLDAILSNASRIAGFKERRNQLTEVNEEQLFYYALSLSLFCNTTTQSWGEQQVDATLEAAADDVSRKLVYAGAPSGAAPKIRAHVLENARNFYRATRDNFERLSADIVKQNDIFKILLILMTRTFPGTRILMTEGHTELLSFIMQRFGTLSLRAVEASQEAGSDGTSDH